MKQKKVFLSVVVIILMVVVSFSCGFIFGKYNTLKKKHKNQGFVKFYQTNKYVGKELDENEKNSIKSFVIPYEDCLIKNLTQSEREKVNNIQKEVIELSKNNDKVKFRFKDLESAKNEKSLIKRVKRCKKQAYKKMEKNNRKLFYSCLKKMRIIDIISIFHGIK